MRSVLIALALCSASPVFAEPIMGFNFPLWSADGYSSPLGKKGLEEIAATGAGWVALTPTLYVKDRKDSIVAAGPDTPSDESLRAAIRTARSLGLKVAFKPHVDSRQGGARAWLSPSNPARWFSSYRAILLRYARLAREEDCSLFVVGTELALLTGPRDWKAWRVLIRDVRAEYPGPLTYAANWHSAAHVGFWRDLDYIGIDAYYPVLGGTDRRLLGLGWLPYEAELKTLSAVHGRPILFTEYGIASQKGANLRPWEWRDFGPADAEVQAAYIEAFLRAFAGKSYVAGFLHWAWDMDPSHSGPGDKSMSVRGKPALDDIEGLFRASRGVSPRPAPSHAPAAARVAAVLSGASSL
ncbi:MAG: glycoside hydrolase family 113 [Elusimicrobiota bacterium]